MRILVMYNNFAADKKSAHSRNKFLEELKNSRIEFDLLEPENGEESTELLAEKELSNYDAIACAGGDGTLFRMLNGYMKNSSAQKIPIAVIPTGTGNAFARDIGLNSGDIPKSVALIKSSQKKKIDIGKFKTQGKEYYFANVIGLGFVTDVARTAHKFKIIGSAAYTLGVLYHTIFLKSFPVKLILDDSVIEKDAVFIEISNTRYTGKDFLMAPAAQIDEGLFDITIMTKCTRTKLLSGLPKIFKGKHIEMKEVETYRASKIKIETGTSKILTPDGEILGGTPLEIECLPNILEVFADEPAT